MHPLRKCEEPPVAEDVWKDKGGEYFKNSQYAEDFSLEEVLRNDGFVYWIPNYVIKSPRECKSIVINPKDLKFRVILIHKDKEDLRGTNVLKYIEWGEEKPREFHKRPTCASRKRWYDLGKWTFATYFWTEFFFERCMTFHNLSHIFESDKHYGIIPKVEVANEQLLGAYLNSSLIPLFRLISGFQSLGEGVLKMPVYEVAKLPVINPELVSNRDEIEEEFKKLENREIETLYDEIGANTPEEVSLDKVKPDRRELDEIVMGEILGLTEEEQLEVYRAVVDLMRSRYERARSVKRRVRKGDVAVEEIAADVLREFGGELRFPEGYIEGEECEEIYIPEEEREPSLESSLEGIFVNFRTLKLRCETREEAKYIEIAVKSGRRRIKIPKDKDAVRRAVQSYLKTREAVRKKIAEYVGNRRSLIERIENLVWKNVLRSALSGEA